MATPKISVREISRRTGYSPATVSNALNNKRGVSNETANEIRRVAADLGYRRSGKLKQVQFVMGRNSGRMLDEGSFRLAVVNGVEEEARANGLTVSYITVELSDSETCKRELAKIMGDPSAGIILLGTEMTQRDYDLFAHSPVPLVLVDGQSDNHFFESILFSNEGSAYRAVRHLVRNGHRQIGYLAGKLRIRNFPLRERGGVQPGYTLRRLRVSELAAFLWQGLAAAAAIFVVLMAVTAVCFFYGLHLQNAGLGEAGELSLLVSFVSSGVTHALLPLGDWPVYIRSAAVIYALGAAAAYSGFMGRRGKLALSPFVLLAAMWLGDGFRVEAGDYSQCLVYTAFCALWLVGMIISIRSREQDEDGTASY